MKIKKIIIFLFILIFFILLPSLIFYISNLAFWPGKNYIFANNLNKKLEKIFPKNDLLKIKKADFYYKLWEYKKALELYSQVDCKNLENCFILYYNIWNTYYKLWDFEEEKLKKISLWQSSLSFYSKALNLKDDLETKKNYDFVLEKLRELMKKEEEKKEEEKKQENNEKKDENKTEENQEKLEKNDTKKQQEDKIQPKQDSIKINENSENASQELSKEEKDEIEKYIEQLKQEEKQNINLNKPKEEKSVFDILEEEFFFQDFDRRQNDR